MVKIDSFSGVNSFTWKMGEKPLLSRLKEKRCWVDKNDGTKLRHNP